MLRQMLSSTLFIAIKGSLLGKYPLSQTDFNTILELC